MVRIVMVLELAFRQHICAAIMGLLGIAVNKFKYYIQNDPKSRFVQF